MLGFARLFWFCFGVFFVLYHLCYENILHQTDGMEYLSDWTFVLLGLVFGLLAWHSLAPASAGPKLTELTVVLHGVCWSTNIVSTFGAWYSFLFFPQCESLEGVDNYPDCYLEWYRFTEHGLNMLILFGDYAVGLVPVRRKDYGYSILFLSVYAMWSWYLWFHVGKCPYVMFDFNAGWSSVPWYASSYARALCRVFPYPAAVCGARRAQGRCVRCAWRGWDPPGTRQGELQRREGRRWGRVRLST